MADQRDTAQPADAPRENAPRTIPTSALAREVHLNQLAKRAVSAQASQLPLMPADPLSDDSTDLLVRRPRAPHQPERPRRWRERNPGRPHRSGLEPDPEGGPACLACHLLLTRMRRESEFGELWHHRAHSESIWNPTQVEFQATDQLNQDPTPRHGGSHSSHSPPDRIRSLEQHSSSQPIPQFHPNAEKRGLEFDCQFHSIRARARRGGLRSAESTPSFLRAQLLIHLEPLRRARVRRAPFRQRSSQLEIAEPRLHP